MLNHFINFILKHLIIPFVLLVNVLIAQPFTPPLPEPGTAVVDGDISEWDTSITGPDFFANMYRAWNQGGGPSGQPTLSYLYLRYDCSTNIMYALVYQKDSSIPFEISGDHWLAIPTRSDKVVQESDGLPNFAFVDVGYEIPSNSNHARGYEAKFSISSTAVLTAITAHGNVNLSGTATTGTSNFEIDLLADCSALPVEMTSFSVTISENLAQLNWETATEINNYGFEVQRSTETTDWNKIGFVNGNGNSNSPKYYTFKDQSVIKSGDYFYRLKQIDIDGTSEYSDVVNINLIIEEMKYKLNQNFPNPFNPSTTISYTVPEKAHVDLIVYNIFGEEITRLVSEKKEIGTYSLNFDADNLAAGIYFYTIQTESYTATKKLILLK